MADRMTEDKARECYAGGIDCSQVVFGYGADVLGFDKETALKIASCFGGGMFRGETCGCVTGALMALGLKYGHTKPGDEETKAELMEVLQEFTEAFAEENGSLICKELIKYDVSDPKQREGAFASGVMMTLCPKLAVSACEILDDLI